MSNILYIKLHLLMSRNCLLRYLNLFATFHSDCNCDFSISLVKIVLFCWQNGEYITFMTFINFIGAALVLLKLFLSSAHTQWSVTFSLTVTASNAHRWLSYSSALPLSFSISLSLTKQCCPGWTAAKANVLLLRRCCCCPRPLLLLAVAAAAAAAGSHVADR